MAALGEILHRFRFHGVPGAPSTISVPADEAAEAQKELAPVFAALQGALRSNGELVHTAELEAKKRRGEAHEAAHGIIEEARSGAAGARAHAAAARLAIADAECRRVLDEGRREAERVSRQAEERMPTLVEQVVTEVLALASPATGWHR